MKNQQVISLEDVSLPRHGQSAAFVFDTRCCDNAVKLAHHADLLVCESTFNSEHIELAANYGHLTSEQAAILARDAKADHLILTHFSQRYFDTKSHLLEASAVHPNTSAAEDGDVYDLPTRKQKTINVP